MPTKQRIMIEITGTPAEIYEQHTVPAIFVHWAPELVERLAVQPGERVLDLACGTGIVTRHLVDRIGPTGRVVGLDVNVDMLAVARRVVPHPAIEWLEGSALAMPLPDAAFDVVVCEQGLQFFADKLAAFREIRRVMAPGGRLTMTVWRAIEHAPGFRLLEEALARRVGAAQAALPPFSLGDAHAICALASRAGFREVQSGAAVKLSRWQSAEHFVRSMVGGAPTMLGALAAQGPSVLDEIVAEVAEVSRGYLDDDGWATPQTTNIITAVV